MEDKKIKLSVPEGQELTQEDKDFIGNSKQEIIQCLVDNNVYSKNYDVLILKHNSFQGELSFAQERLWFLQKYEGNTQSYNTPIVFKISSEINLRILKQSIKELILRHHVLRTMITETKENSTYQTIIHDKELIFKVHQYLVKTLIELDSKIKEDVNYIFNLSREIPIRVVLYELDAGKSSRMWHMSIVIHHIAFDGWSFDIFLRELEHYYQYHLNKKLGLEAKLNLPELPIQYKDFALWQRSYLTGRKLDQQISYWKEKLLGYETLNLITDYPRPEEMDYSGRDIYFELDELTSEFPYTFM